MTAFWNESQPFYFAFVKLEQRRNRNSGLPLSVCLTVQKHDV